MPSISPNQPNPQKRALEEIRKKYKISTPPGSATQPKPAPPAIKAPRKPVSQPPAKPPAKPPAPRANGKRKPSRPKRRWVKRSVLTLLLVLFTFGSVFGYKIISAGNKISTADQSILGQLRDLLFKSGEPLMGEDERINILLIAIGGEGHAGAELADTVMVASIMPETNELALLSIPRDLWVQIPETQIRTKINSVHSYGESRKKNGGPEMLQKSVEEITGLPLHYYGRIDFAAFKGIVDAVGGVNITIENGFHDHLHRISFPAGTERMNGERVLAYVRARYIEGPEGGDFRRAARQQQVLLAIRERIFSVNTALDFRAMNNILDSLSGNITTNMHLREMRRFFELARMLDANQARSLVLSTGDDGVLVSKTETLNGTPVYALHPRTGDYSEIRHIAANIFSEEMDGLVTTGIPDEEAAAPDTPEPTAQAVAMPTLEIRNGTNIPGLAKQTADAFTSQGYTVKSIGNAANRSVETTTIYALTAKSQESAAKVQDIITANAIESGIPAGEVRSSADILIILGSDANRS